MKEATKILALAAGLLTGGTGSALPYMTEAEVLADIPPELLQALQDLHMGTTTVNLAHALVAETYPQLNKDLLPEIHSLYQRF